jgi:hypothetical protein
MRMYKLLNQANGVLLRSNKLIQYETIDFLFRPRHLYTSVRIRPTEYKIPDVSYDEQYECRDFTRGINSINYDNET